MWAVLVLVAGASACGIPPKANLSSRSHKVPAKCSKYPTHSWIGFNAVGTAWVDAGNNKHHCAAAVIIAAGECQSHPTIKGGCDLTLTGASGVWQVDAARGAGHDLRNPCVNAWAAMGVIDRTLESGSWDRGCYTHGGTAPEVVKDHGPSHGNCNFIGPFCHLQVGRNGRDPSCCAWTGGHNAGQVSFEHWYYSRLLVHSGKSVPKSLAHIKAKSLALAHEYCGTSETVV